MQELRTATDFALQATKRLTEQTEAIKHILPRREFTKPPAPKPSSAAPLACRLEVWLSVPNPSCWLIQTVRFGYAFQFTRHPPRFRRILFTSVHSDTDASVLRVEIAVLLAKDAIEPVPPAEMKLGFYSPYFIVLKNNGGLRPILDRRVFNQSLLNTMPFKMLIPKRIISCIRHQDWFAAIDLKDAYFNVSILPRHRPFLRFAFEGRAYQYKVLPFGLTLSPRVFTKLVEGALAPLWERGIGILNYLDNWLIIAHSQDLLCEHRDLVLQHLSLLGLQVNWEKNKLSPMDPEMGMAPWHISGRRYPGVSPPFQPVVGPGSPTGRSALRTDASRMGWGAVCNGQAVLGSWTGPRLQWHINCLELLAVFFALCQFLLML
ncbi:Gag-Pro-Pol polyprotein [Labeo rohita]|uniref:ribonuclease H n=1 Tax=Labeo rohita TaxID=84645 RepID=A0ABQ8L368_LABRO|nr:Gag-Pro-Pol polyprotein [Labeo rohita]